MAEGPTIAIMQPYLLPYLGYFQLMAAADVFVVFDNVAFIKRGYINRNSILLGGEPHRFTLPVRKASQNRLIMDHEIQGEPTDILDLFSRAYEKAPHAQEGLALIREALAGPLPNIADFLTDSLSVLARALDLKCEILRASDLDVDLSLKAQDRIIALVRALGGRSYVNAAGGRDLYDPQHFGEAGIDLHFIEYAALPYSQYGYAGAFVPNLSIVDHLVNRPLDAIRNECFAYQLKSA